MPLAKDEEAEALEVKIWSASRSPAMSRLPEMVEVPEPMLTVDDADKGPVMLRFLAKVLEAWERTPTKVERDEAERVPVIVVLPAAKVSAPMSIAPNPVPIEPLVSAPAEDMTKRLVPAAMPPATINLVIFLN